MAFTFARVPEVMNSPSSFVFATKPVTRMEVVDPHTVRMIFADPAPLYPVIVPAVRIVSRKNGAGATTADYNSGKAAIGTGPYKLVSAMLGDWVEFKRNETGWDKKPAFETVIYRMIPNSASRIAALQSGDVDAIDAVPPRDVATIKADPNIQILSQASQRLIYLAPDVSREVTPFITDLDGKPIPNPLRDVRVRRALSLAINRDGIRDRIIYGFAVPTGQIMSKGTSGCDPSIIPDPFNLAEAKKLLAEAGYPNGFAMTLHGPNDRYVDDGAIVEAIAQMWTRLGLKITVNTLPTSVFFSAAGRDEFSMRLTGWASDTGEASSNLITLVASSNPDKGPDRTLLKSKYANPKADVLVEKAIATADDAEREALYREATRLGMAELAIIPIHNQVNVWAVRKGVTFHPRIAEGMRALDFEPTK